MRQRAVIRLMVLRKKRSKENYEELVATLGDNALSYATVKKLEAIFKAGPENWSDDDS